MIVNYNIAPYIMREMERYLNNLLEDYSDTYIVLVFAPFVAAMGLVLSYDYDGFRISLVG